VNKTLFRYIGLDLLKGTALTLVVLTLTLTTLGIIEPLRKQGLDASQALLVFVMTLPVMLSLTLPIAALFSACLVYGRFSQDNELLASRASGISTLSLLRPALLLGILVTALSWSMSNNLAPMMAKRGTEAIQSNLRGLMCRRLSMRGFLALEKLIIHAERVHRYDKYDQLEGVVAVERDRSTGHVKVVCAKSAWVTFDIDAAAGKAYVDFTLIKPFIMESDSTDVLQQEELPLDSVPLKRRIKEKPAWYSWSELRATLDDPTRSITVRQAIPGIRRAICNDIFATRVYEALKTTGVYDKFTRHGEEYVIKAGDVRVEGTDTVRLLAGGENGKQPVEVTVIRNDRQVRRATAAAGYVRINWGKFTETPYVSIILTKDVLVLDLDALRNDPADLTARLSPEDWKCGQIAIPEDINLEIVKVTPYAAYHNGGKGGGLTDNPAIHNQLKTLNDDQVVQLRRDIKAEMHSRAAYSVSCLLMVMLGAALGLIFRGGQFVSAFATSAVPATLVIVVIMMGKKISQNPDVLVDGNPEASVVAGTAVVWGGILLMAVGTAWVYAYLARR